MRTVVFAYHSIGCTGLKALLDSGFQIVALFTHRDNPNENIWFDSVAELAAENHIPVYSPENVNHPMWRERIASLNPDYLFSFYYRRLISKKILDLATKGAFNLHGSLLPKYRGRCPVNWVLVNGERETGVTLHHMTAKADAGDIVGQRKVPISEDDTAKSLFDKLNHEAAILLRELLPQIAGGTAAVIPQNDEEATYFGGRTPEDGRIDWNQSATDIRNLVRAVTRPYPGAFSFAGGRKIFFWEVAIDKETSGNASPGTVLNTDPLTIQCGENSLQVTYAQQEGGVFQSGTQLAQEMNIVKGSRLLPTPYILKQRRRVVLILGVDGFIGNALTERLLADGKYQVLGLDVKAKNVERFHHEPHFEFHECDIAVNRELVEYYVKKCDIVLPLVAIATPIEYIRHPLRVFELDFEENLRIVRHCVKYQKRLLFPSTSEVYGMCSDPYFDENHSNLVLGPIKNQRWIYSCSKQLLDRVIWAYGMEQNLDFTLFRPFNWIGPRLDSLQSARIGSSRAITQLVLNLVQGTPIHLVEGGTQKRCFTDLDDGIDCLARIIDDENHVCRGNIFNIGNPKNELSIKQLAEMLIEHFENHPLRHHFPPFAGFQFIEQEQYYGQGYEDIQRRRPRIRQAKRLLGWSPVVDLHTSVEKTLDFFLKQALNDRNHDVSE